MRRIVSSFRNNRAAITWIVFPALVGGALAVAIAAGVAPLIVTLSFTTWSLALYAGLLASAAMALLIYGIRRRTRRERERADAALAALRETAADERRRFLRRLDHEVKNPLMAIRAGLANLPAASQSASIGSQIERLSSLVGNLRKIADIETQPLDRSRVDIAALLNEAVALAEDHPNAKARRVALSLPRAPWPVSSIDGDYDLLVLAIYNLIENALKYSAEGATVEVRVVEDGPVMLIEVANTGSSIPEDDLSQVFDELYRGEDAKRMPGSGLGLALVRTVIHRHGGAITPRSRPGQGTAFTIRLPLDANRPL
jgi:two-component system, OmpR family, sensor kinase